MGRGKDEALKSIFKGASIVFIGVIASKLLSFGFRILVGRRLGVADYGVITVMMAVFSVANTFGHMGLNQGVQRFVSMYRAEEDTEGMIGLARTGYLMILVPSSIVAVSVFFLAPWLATTVWSDPKLVWPIRMAVLAVPLYGIARVSISVLNAFEKMQYKVYINKLWANISQLVIAAVLIAVGYGYMGAAFGFAFGFGSSAVLGLLFVNKVFPAVFERVTGRYEFSELWSHSWPLFAAGVFGIVSGHIDTFMLQYFESSEAVGLYQSAYPFAVLLLMGNSMFNAIFLSRASYMVSETPDELAGTFRVVVKWVGIVTVPVFMLLFVFPRLALVFFGAEFYAAENVLRVLLAGFMLQSLIGPSGKIYQAMDRTKIMTVLSILGAAGNFALNLLLIPRYGIIGAAGATAGTIVLLFGIRIMYLYKLLGTHPFRWSTVRVFGAGLTAIGVVFAASRVLFETMSVWPLVLVALAFAGLYPALVVVFGALEQEDLEIVYAVEDRLPFDGDRAVRVMERFMGEQDE